MKKIIPFIFLLAFFCQNLTAQTKAPLEPTATKALLHVNLSDFEGNPKSAEVVIFQSKNSGKSIQRKSDQAGKLSVLLPKGDTYFVKYRSFLKDKQSTEIEIPNEEGIMEATLEVQMEQVKNETYSLDVHFDPAKATIQSISYKVLGELVASMKRLSGTKIELAGHTDSDGSAESNLKLSQDRAAAVKAYLVSKGISASRIQTVGYGESRPVAQNSSEAGRAKNRRTEVRVIESN